MNAKQSSIYGMLHRLESLLRKNEAKLKKLPRFSELLLQYISNLLEMGLINRRLETDITGVRDDKLEVKQRLVEKMLEVCDVLRAYGMLEGLPSLIKNVDFTESFLLHVGEEKLVSNCFMVCDMGKVHFEKAQPYGVSAAMLADLQSQTEIFQQVLHSPKNAAVERKQLVTQLEILFEQQAQIVEKMDALFAIIRRSEPDLYNLFQETRRVVYHHGSLMVRGVIRDAVTQTGLLGVEVTFRQGDEDILTKLSAENGGFSIKTIDEGEYDVRISKMGYETKMLSFTVVDGELQVLEVELTKRVNALAS